MANAPSVNEKGDKSANAKGVSTSAARHTRMDSFIWIIAMDVAICVGAG